MKWVSLNKKNCLRENFSGQKHSQIRRFPEKSVEITD